MLKYCVLLDGKVGIPGAARQEMVRVQQSRAVRRMVNPQYLVFVSAIVLYLFLYRLVTEQEY